jgi:hypothetical protein
MQTGAGADLAQLARGGLSPFERVLALQRVPLFLRVPADEMHQLAGITGTLRRCSRPITIGGSANWGRVLGTGRSVANRRAAANLVVDRALGLCAPAPEEVRCSNIPT